MAGDYGLDSGGNVVIQQPANTGNGPATRLSGGGVSFNGFAQPTQAPQSNFGVIGDSSARTLEALNKLTEGLVQPLIQAEQKRQYFDGMAQVAQGKTLVEIQKDQPWFTRIFGPTASVQGAQAMTLMGAMNTAETQFYQQLPELSQQAPDVARAWLVKQAGELSQTGDPSMDAMVQAKLAEQFGPMLNMHMKQHVKYVQEQNNTAYGNNLVTSGEALQHKLNSGADYFNPEQVEQEKLIALDAFKPMPGMSRDAWETNTTKALRAGMMKGNFAIYEAFKGTDEYKSLPIATKEHLETQVLPYATQWVQKSAPSFWDDMYSTVTLEAALSQGAGPATPKELNAVIDMQNAAFLKQTGGSKLKFDNTGRAKMQELFIRGQEYRAKQQAAAHKAQAGIEAEYQDAVAQKTAVMAGLKNNGALPFNNTKIAPEAVQGLYSEIWQDLSGDPAGQAQHLKDLAVMSNNGSKWVNQGLSTKMTTAANNFLQQGVPISDEMQQQLGYMQSMTTGSNGLAGLANYVGAENAAKMTALIQSGVDLKDPSAMDTVRTSIERGWNAPTTEKDRKAVRSFLADNDTTLQKYLPIFGKGALTGMNLNDANKARLSSLLEPQVARLVKGNGLAIEDAIQLSFSLMFGDPSKVDYVDGALTEPNAASKWKSMFSAVTRSRDIGSQADEDYQSAVSTVIDRAMGFDVDKSRPVMDQTLSAVDKFANTAATFANDVIEYKLTDGVRPFNETGTLRKDSDAFDPENYATATVQTIGDGVLRVQRIPKNASPTMRPVSIVITAEQVVSEFDKLVKARAVKTKDQEAEASLLRSTFTGN